MEQCFIFLEGIKRVVEDVDREGSYGVIEAEGEENQKLPFNLALSSVLMARVARRIAHLQVEQSRNCSRVMEIYQWTREGRIDSGKCWRDMTPLIERSREIIREVEDLKLSHKQLLIGFLFLNEYLRRTVDPDFERGELTNTELYRLMEEELSRVLQQEADTIFSNSYDPQASLHDFCTRKFPYPIKDKALLRRLETLMGICMSPLSDKSRDHPFAKIASTILDTQRLASDRFQLNSILSEICGTFADLFPEPLASEDKIHEIPSSSSETAGKGGVFLNYDPYDTLHSDLTDFICHYLMLMAFTFADTDPLFNIFADTNPEGFISFFEAVLTMPMLVGFRYLTKIFVTNPVLRYGISSFTGIFFRAIGGASLSQGLMYYFGYNPGWMRNVENVKKFFSMRHIFSNFGAPQVLDAMAEAQGALNQMDARKMINFFRGDGVWGNIIAATKVAMEHNYVAPRVGLASIQTILLSGLEGTKGAFGGFLEYLSNAPSNMLVNWIHALSSPYGAVLLFLSWGIVTSGTAADYLLNGFFDSSEIVQMGVVLHAMFILVRQSLWLKITELYLEETALLHSSYEVTTDELISDELLDMLRSGKSSVLLEYQPISGYLVPRARVAGSGNTTTTRQHSTYENMTDSYFWYLVSLFVGRGGQKYIFNYGEMTAMQLGIRDYIRVLNSLFGGSLSSMLPPESTSHFQFLSLKTLFDLVAPPPQFRSLGNEAAEAEKRKRRILYRKRMAYQAVLQGMTLLNDLALMISVALIAGLGAMNLSGSFPMVGQSGGTQDIASHPLQTAVALRVGFHVITVASSFFATSGLSVFMTKGFSNDLGKLILFQFQTRAVSSFASFLKKRVPLLTYEGLSKSFSSRAAPPPPERERTGDNHHQSQSSPPTFDETAAVDSVIAFWEKMTTHPTSAIYAQVASDRIVWDTWSNLLGTSHQGEIDALLESEVQSILVTYSEKDKQIRYEQVANSYASKFSKSCDVKEGSSKHWNVSLPRVVNGLLVAITGSRGEDTLIGRKLPAAAVRKSEVSDKNILNHLISSG